MTTETNPMSVTEAMAAMHRPSARAEMMCGDVYVALYPYGVGHGGTSMVCGLDREAAIALRHELDRAITLAEES